MESDDLLVRLARRAVAGDRDALDELLRELEPPPALEGNAYESDAKRFPSTLREGIEALEHGTMARGALGDQVVDHYLNYARTEQRLFDEVVTCYERERMFERG